MKLINNRYKIDKIIDEDLDGTTCQVTDLWESKKNIMLRLLKGEKKDQLIEYFINWFLSISSIRHKYLLYNDRFDIVYNVDNQNIKKNKYFFIKELCECDTLSQYYNKLNFKGRLMVVQKICDVVHYLHFRGIVYKYLNPDNIYIYFDEDTGEINIKLLDIATLKEREINNKFLYDDSNKRFVAPEVFFDFKKESKSSDYYSIGMIMEYLLKSYFNNIVTGLVCSNNTVQNDLIIDGLHKLVMKLTRESLNERYGNLQEINQRINSIINSNYNFNYNKYRENLNFNTNIVGRNNELNTFYGICRKIANESNVKKMICVKGKSGIGKTRFLSEIYFQLYIRGKNVYFTSIPNNKKERLAPIISILKQLVKNCRSNLLEKYGCELVKIIPELKFIDGIKPSTVLNGDKEKLRLFYRITNFILDYMKDEPMFLIFDNIHNSDKETLELIKYIVLNAENKPLLIVSSYTSSALYENLWMKDLLESSNTMNIIEEIELFRMSVEEIGEIIKNILGIDFVPINFSTKLIYDTLGNPRYIEEVLKNLFTAKELYINSKGTWTLKAENYSSLYIPSKIDEVMEKQINLIESKLYGFVETISIFNTSISKSIIRKVTKMEDKDLDEIINKLVQMKILDERVEDWGYTYDFYNFKIKSYIYHNISSEQREKLHRVAANVLEDIYIGEGRDNISELIYHLMMSSQNYKAVEYLIVQAKKMEGILNNYALILWKNAYHLLSDSNDIKKIEIMVNIGMLLSSQGSNMEALDIYCKVASLAKTLDEYRYIAICKINIGEILFRKNKVNNAERYILQAKELFENIQDNKGIYDCVILLNKILFSRGDIDNVLKISNKYFAIVTDQGLFKYMGYFANHIGLSYIYLKSIDDAQKYLERSITYFKEAGLYVECTKPLNNIGVLYAEYYYDFNKAMKYYKKGLEICETHNKASNKIWFLNNIGEVYIRKHEYTRAREYMEKAHNIAMELGEESLVITIIINLSLIYLEMGKYDVCYKYFIEARERYGNYPEYNENLDQYFDFLSSYYFKMGVWDKALQYAKLSQNNCKKSEQYYFIRSQCRTLFIEYYNSSLFNKIKINNMRETCKKNCIYGEQRKFLLMIAQISISHGNFDYAREVLSEDEDVANIFDTPYLNLYRKIIYSVLETKNKKDLVFLEKKVKDSNINELNLLLNYYLGNLHFEQENYDEAASYYLNYMNIVYNLAINIKEKYLQISFINKHLNNEIKNNFKEIIRILTGKKIGHKIWDKLDESTDLKEYFDLCKLVSMLNSKAISKIMLRHTNISIEEGIDSLKELLLHFSCDYLNNIELILKYAIKDTFAKRGAIFVYDDEADKLVPLVFRELREDNIISNEILTYLRLNNEGVLINDTTTNKYNYSYLKTIDGDIKALMCVPIFKMQERKNKSRKYDYQKDRRKIKYEEDIEEIVGCIYLDTDNLFHRFDSERLKIVKALTYLAYINIDNHYLKIISSIDKMTGVYTRKYFDMVFEQYIKKLKEQKESFAVLMLDIDLFKNVNDTFGHQKGDEILGRIGSVLLKSVRNSDIVGRYGGEEFIIILKDAGKKQGKVIAEKIRKTIENLKLIDFEHFLTVSIGISVFPTHGQYKDELIEKSDQALYIAKKEGRNKTVVWENNVVDSKKRVDKLAGIVTGNTMQDQRNILVLIKMINLVGEDIPLEDKVFRLLGRVIGSIDAKQGQLFIVNDAGDIAKIYSRRRFVDEWDEAFLYNKGLIKRVIKNKVGEYLIDWESVEEQDIISGNPNWQSVIIIPLIFNNNIKGILQVLVPIKEKEFDYNDYNLVNTIASIVSPIFL